MSKYWEPSTDPFCLPSDAPMSLPWSALSWPADSEVAQAVTYTRDGPRSEAPPLKHRLRFNFDPISSDEQSTATSSSWQASLPPAVRDFLSSAQLDYQEADNSLRLQMPSRHGTCPSCHTPQTMLHRHYERIHAEIRLLWFCPDPTCAEVRGDWPAIRHHFKTGHNTRRFG